MATGEMASGGREGEREGEGALGYVLSLPAAALPLPVAVSCLDATVPRKARSRPRVRAQPCSWWTFELPVPAPEEAKSPAPTASATNPTEEARPRRPPRPRQAPPPDPHTLAPAMERPSKRARRCLQCGAAETPQWRSGPMGPGTLCNACGVRLKAAGALREQVHRPPPATARTVAEPPPESPVSPVSDSSPDGPIWEPGSVPDVYLLRKKPPKQGRSPPPRTEPASPPAPAVFLVKKKKKKKAPKTPKKKPWRPRKSAKRCLHCGSSSTPQWREGPLGRSTLCNACGVRYRQGRLLPEYRPLASPTFEPSEHANRHSQVLQLHRQRKSHKNQHPLPTEPRPGDDPTGAPACSGGDDPMNVLLPRRWHNKDEYPPTPLHQPLPQPADSLAGDQHVAVGDIDDSAQGRGGGGSNGPNDAPSSLDSLLLEGPSAPLIVDGDESLIN
ncbi:ras-associated and pleckstrin homology domains-containing protein 1-like isoform X2 [Panicum miliaceum]|uniref:Ras-associated and pleckstrin homology domains-containing protein 1-like isoform X2 n=1 Tax=Panicum miliaceum TaxID=4540 RepID=A0A3L6SVK8_PANMI|nr:ras-associated and pleckstrin homology domains-containing protein 1-like isoform X2 [Panicum miliaceum]